MVQQPRVRPPARAGRVEPGRPGGARAADAVARPGDRGRHSPPGGRRRRRRRAPVRRLLRKPLRPAAIQGEPVLANAGLGTRGIALAIDALLAQLIFLTIGATVGLIGSLVGGPDSDWLVGIAAGVGLGARRRRLLRRVLDGRRPDARDAADAAAAARRVRLAAWLLARARPARRPGCRDRDRLPRLRAGAVRRPPPRAAGLARRHHRVLRRARAARRRRVSGARPARRQLVGAASAGKAGSTTGGSGAAVGTNWAGVALGCASPSTRGTSATRRSRRCCPP